jgi:hypothetical protein
MKRGLGLFTHRDASGTALALDFSAARLADPWTGRGQMFVSLLLTARGSVPSDPRRGTDFLPDLLAGRIYSDLLLKSGFDFAAWDVFDYLRLRGYNDSGDPDRLASAALTRWSVQADRVELHVEMRSAAGDKIRYDLPIRL